MKLIDRYVATILKNIPGKLKDEVERELRNSIDEMAGGDYSEENVTKTLYELGNPVTLSDKYQEGKNFVVAPSLINAYKRLLLPMLAIVCAAMALLSIYKSIETLYSQNLNIDAAFFTDMFSRMFANVLSSGQAVFTWITLVFFALSRIDSKYIVWPASGKPWTIKDLDEYIPKARALSKPEVIVETVLTCAVFIVLGIVPNIIGWYEKINGSWEIIPFFNLEALQKYFPLLIAITVIGTTINMVKSTLGRWNKPLLLADIIYSALSLTYPIAVLTNKNIISHEFKQKLLNLNASLTDDVTNILLLLILLVIIVITAAEIISKALKLNKI